MMKALLIDIGNTRTKAAISSGEGRMKSLGGISSLNASQFIDRLLETNRPSHCLISTVQKKKATLSPPKETKMLWLDRSLQLPIKINYKTSETLGGDRVAAACGAETFSAKGNNLIIDCGTTITIDFVQKGTFIGGNISPGAHMRLKSLRQGAELLSDKELSFTNYGLTGHSSAEAIANGILQGILLELAGYRSCYQKKYNGLKTFLTGGDAALWGEKLGKESLVEPELLFWGMLRIMELNA